MKSLSVSGWMLVMVLCAGVNAARADGSGPARPAARATAVDGPTAGAASWCDHYRIGPGDVFTFSLYGHPEARRDKITVGPDGNLTYLQAINLHVAGLTIDELRAQMEPIFAATYKMPRVLIAPVELRSKKYFIVGKVVENGDYLMDRPTTLVEALAKAHGLETGLVENRNADLADLSHSFLVRHGRRLKVDFEALLLNGDLSQNVRIEPDDYIYIALARAADINIFGQVARPGVQAYSPHLGVAQGITSRGGYTEAAYREKVLIVRGAVTHPQSIVVNTNDVLKGKVADVELQPNDIVYVSARPWKFAEELVDTAIAAFTQAAVTTYVSHDVPQIIRSPVLPQTGVNLQ